MSERTNDEQPGRGSALTADTAVRSAKGAVWTKRALLVDDHGVFREVLGIVLEHHAGFGESVHASSLAEARRALNVLKNGRGEFGLAVVDLDLPGGEGFEFLDELREAAPGIPVIAITTSMDRDLRARASEAGAREVLATTASGEEIVAAARRLVGGVTRSSG